VVDNALFSAHNRWMIQIPRIYNIFRSKGIVGSFQASLARSDTVISAGNDSNGSKIPV
jgi:hypothetical protein